MLSARFAGTRRPDEIVILGAHLDSWELGTGALDNGCNAALVIEAAPSDQGDRAFCRGGRSASCFSAGEEQGTIGSFEYVKAHPRGARQNPRDDHVRLRALARVHRIFAGAGAATIEAGVREVLNPLEAWGAKQSHVWTLRSAPIISISCSKGVPTLVANQEEAN